MRLYYFLTVLMIHAAWGVWSRICIITRVTQQRHAPQSVSGQMLDHTDYIWPFV